MCHALIYERALNFGKLGHVPVTVADALRRYAHPVQERQEQVGEWRTLGAAYMLTTSDLTGASAQYEHG